MFKTVKKIISSLVLISTVTTCLTFPVKAIDIPLAGWSISNSGNQKFETEIDTSVKHSGNASYRMSYKTVGGTDVYAMLRQYIPVKPNTTYRYGFWAKAEKIKNIFTSISWGTRYHLTTFGENYDWKYFEFEWYSGDRNQAEFQIILDGNTKNIWLDDLFFIEKGKTSNLLANPGIEDGITYDMLQQEIPQGEDAPAVSKEESKIFKIAEGGLDFLKARFLPTYKNSSVVIDGDLSDWSNAVPVSLPGVGYTPTMRTMYDDEYFYLSAELDDEVQTAITSGTGLDGKDCLVVVIGKESEVYGTDMKAVFTENGKLHMYSEQWHESDYEKMVTYGKNENGRTVYELAYPWSLLGTRPENDDLMLNIAVVDHDDSPEGRRSVEFATGMGTTRQNDDFIRAHCMDGDVTETISLPNPAYTGENVDCSVIALNPTNSAMDVTVDVDNDKDTVKLKSGEAYKKVFTKNFAESGINNIPVTITYGDKEVKVNKEADISRSEKKVYEDADKIKNVLLPELKSLIDECKAKGITVGYEESYYHNIDFNLELIPEAMAAKKLTHAEFILDDLMTIYNETKDNLKAYLAGEKKARDTYQYENSHIEKEGQITWGDAVKYSTGEVERRPVFLNGFNSFRSGEPANVFKGLGYNFLSIEFGINDAIIDANGIFGWEVIGGKPDTQVNVVYEDASKKNSFLRVSSQSGRAPESYKQIWHKYQGKPNTEYEFGFRVKAKNATGVWLAGNGWNSERVAIPEGTYEWREVKSEFVSKDSTNLEFFIICEDKVDELFIDDIYCYEKGTKTNLIGNGDFELGREYEEYEGMRFMSSNIDPYIQIIRDAAEKDVSICLQIATHYWPGFTLDGQPDGRCAGSFTDNVNYSYERVRVVTEFFLKNLLPMVKDEENLHSIILGNEPGFCTLNNIGFYNPLWKEYLIHKYDNDIAKLNKNYNEDYTSFDEVTLEEVIGDCTNTNWMAFAGLIDGRDQTPIFYDWMMFNFETYTDWVAFMYNTVKKYAPDVDIHIKQMSGRWRYEHAYFRTWLRNGINAEMLSQVTDYHGCDSQGILNNEEQSMQTKMRWYDYITSLKNMPVMNSEDHIIPDNTNNLDPKYAPWAGATIWQGAIHGCTGVTTWVWARNYEWNEGNGSVTQRPYAMKKQTDATFDLNRLAYEVKALTDSKADVAVMDSYSAHALDAVYENVAFNAWQSSCYSGQRTDFITEKLCEEGKLSQYKVVILPKCDRVPKSVIDALNNYNGRIILLGEDNLKYDEYGNPHDPALYKGIYDRARIVPITWENLAMTSPLNLEIRNILLEEYAALGMNKVMLIDTATNKPVYDVEWEYAEYNGKIIINANNYNWNALPTVAVEINGQRVSVFTELRSEEKKNGTITIEPYEPVLLMCE